MEALAYHLNLKHPAILDPDLQAWIWVRKSRLYMPIRVFLSTTATERDRIIEAVEMQQPSDPFTALDHYDEKYCFVLS